MYVINNQKYYFMTTRFNNETYQENLIARRKYLNNNYENGCLYGTPKKICENIPIHSKIFVFEMNNDKNKIEGIGFITNKIYYKNKYKIYSDNFYNKYIYKGYYWISREELEYNTNNIEYIRFLDNVLFKSYDHMKRGYGITLFTQKKFKLIKKELFKFIRLVFIKKYTS